MPDIFGPFTPIQTLVVAGPWSAASAQDAEGRQVRLTYLNLLPDAPEDEVKRLSASFQRVVDAAAGGATPSSVLEIVSGGVQDGVFWLAEGMPSGPSLYETIQASGPISPDHLIPLMHEVASALEPLHAAGMYHAWLTPLNIFPNGASVCLGGWVWPGIIAKLLNTECLNQWPDATFASPEVTKGSIPDSAAEVYSAAALASFTALASPISAEADLGALPPALSTAIMRGLSTDRSARYSSVKELVVDVTVEQAIAMEDEAGNTAIPEGGDIPDWANDLLAETTARRETGQPLVELPQEPAPKSPPARIAHPSTRPQAVPHPTPPKEVVLPVEQIVNVEPARTTDVAEPAPTVSDQVFQWNVGSAHKKSWVPVVVSTLSIVFVLLGIAVTVLRHH